MFYAAPPPPPVSYVDPAGDSGTAPDIVKTTVASDGTKFYFTFTFRTPYGSSSNLLIYLNTDEKATTGDPNGFDYLLQPSSLEMWDAAAGDFEPVASEPFAVTNGGLTVVESVNIADLGGATEFEFLAESLDGAGGAGHMDTTGGTYPGKAEATKLTVASTHQSTAKSGGTWSTEMSAVGTTRLPDGTKGTVTCKGTAGGKRLAVAHQTAIVGGIAVSGVCLFRVPKTARHKRLTASVTVSVNGGTATRTFTTTAK